MLEKMKIQGNRILLPAVMVAFAAVMRCGMAAEAAEMPQATCEDTLIQHQSVSDNALDDVTSISSVSDNSALAALSGNGAVDDAQEAGNAEEGQGTEAEGEEEGAIGIEEIDETGEAGADSGVGEIVQEVFPVPVQAVDSNQLQTINYKDGILTDWQQIMDALRMLSPDSLANPDVGGESLVLQLQNVSDIPAGIKDSIVSGDSGYAKYLHCNIGYGTSLVFSGDTDNSGFCGIGNTAVTVDCEKRGKKSMAVTVRFASHEDIGTIASLQVNLPQCSKGTKVSVYAEMVSVDEDGNVAVGENACIGNTKADENGNVEVLIQSTANYMFVYKEAKE